MMFCKRCGGITMDGICRTCFTSNFVSHLSPRFQAGLELNFFSPTVEFEKTLRWKDQLEDRENFIPKFQNEAEKKEMIRNIGDIATIKIKENQDLLSSKRDGSSSEAIVRRSDLDPIESLLNVNPLLKKRFEWFKTVEKNASTVSDLKGYKLPPNPEQKEKPKTSKLKDNKETEIYKVID
jgi:hypothetical protein